MKKFLVVLLFSIYLSACGSSNSDSGPSPNINPDINNIPSGKILLQIPSSHTKAMSNSDAASQSDIYEVVIYNAENIITADNGSEDIGSVGVPVGEYKIIALTGKKSGATSTSTMLLGTGEETNVIVTEGATTSVTIHLEAVDFDITTPEEVTCGHSYNASISGDLHTNAIIFYHHEFKMNDTDHSFTVTRDNTSFTGGVDLNAPGQPGEDQLKVLVTTMKLEDSEYGISEFASAFSSYEWRLRYYYFGELFPDAPFYDEVIKTINVVNNPTGVSASLIWND